MPQTLQQQHAARELKRCLSLMSQAIQHGDTYNAASHMQDVTKYILMAQEEGLKVFEIDEITNDALLVQ